MPPLPDHPVFHFIHYDVGDFGSCRRRPVQPDPFPYPHMVCDSHCRDWGGWVFRQADQLETIQQNYLTVAHQTYQDALGWKKAAIGMTCHKINRPNMS